MTTTRKQYSPQFKARVVMEAIHGERTLNQLASEFHGHPVQIGQWRKTALEQLPELIGRLKVELDWLKKKLVCSSEERRPPRGNQTRRSQTYCGRKMVSTMGATLEGEPEQYQLFETSQYQ
jgi:transposase-like protein